MATGSFQHGEPPEGPPDQPAQAGASNSGDGSDQHGERASRPEGEGDLSHAPGLQQPDWTHGLRQLYDSVVDEPLPESFTDLLARFDADEEADASGDGASPSETQH